MKNRRARFIAAFVNTLLIIGFFLLRYTGLAVFRIGGAVPIVLIPLLLSIIVFYDENAGLLSSLLTGILMDTAASESSVFNTLFFVIAGTACFLLATRYLNRNLKASICLSLGLSFGYFFIKHLIFVAFRGIGVNYDYFLIYLIPSAFYTALLFIPFYFFQKYFIKFLERRY